MPRDASPVGVAGAAAAGVVAGVAAGAVAGAGGVYARAGTAKVRQEASNNGRIIGLSAVGKARVRQVGLRHRNRAMCKRISIATSPVQPNRTAPGRLREPCRTGP